MTTHPAPGERSGPASPPPGPPSSPGGGSSAGRRRPAAALGRLILAAGAVLALGGAAGGPALAGDEPLHLRDPEVAPRAVGPGQLVHLAVAYRLGDGEGVPVVEAQVGPLGVLLIPSGPDGGRVRFAGALVAPSPGRWPVSFRAHGDGASERLDAGWIVVGGGSSPPPRESPSASLAPRPSASLAPRPSTRPLGPPPVSPPVVTPPPGARDDRGGRNPEAPPGALGGEATAPGRGPAPSAPSVPPAKAGAGAPPPSLGQGPPSSRGAPFSAAEGGAPSARPGGGGGGGDGAPTLEAQGPGPKPRPLGAAGGAAGPSGPLPGNDLGRGDPVAGAVLAVVRMVGDPAGGASQLLGTLTALPTAITGSPLGPYVRLLPVMVSTAGGVALMMGFLLFGKRRRGGEPPAPDPVLHAAAARGEPPASSQMLPPPDPEAHLPRWRRPSLLEARRSDPLRNPVERPPLTFDAGAVPPVEGRERRRIRYRLVRLLDAPDELRSAEVGVLDQGDEVQLLERSGAYWFILAPDGQRGWVHRMVLEELPPSPGAAEGSGRPAADPGGEAGVLGDALAAYLSARRRLGRGPDG